MKKILTLLFLFFAVMIGFAQAPNMINYQGIARNSVGNVLPNQAISVKLSIRDLTATGAVVYTEIRNVTTNFYGLFSFGIGGPGATGVTGTIAGVNWATGAKFLQVEIDPAGGSSFTNVGTTQLLSVPYSLYSNAAAPIGAAGGDLSGTYPNPTVARIRGVNVLATAPLNRQVLKFNGTDWVPARDSLTLPFNVNDTNLTSFIINNTRLTGQTVVISAIMRTTTNVSAAISGIDGSSGAVSPVDSKTFGVIGITGNTGIGVGGYAINGTALRGAVSGTGLALHTTGPVRLDGISPGLGKVLTSDATGNATWQVLGGGGLGAVTGSGTLNYVPKWTPDGNTLGNSLIFDNGTNVGIGTTTPTTPLEIATGAGQFATALSILPSTHATSKRADIRLDDWAILQDITGGSNTKDFAIYQISGGQQRFMISTGGDIGIGTITPSYKLEVVHGGATGIRSRSTGSFSVVDIDGFNGDAALRFQKAGVGQWNIRNAPTTDNLQFFELGGGGERMRIENTTGAVVVTGDFTAGGVKAFTIDHPLDPQNKILMHAAAESNEVINFYSGNAKTDANGKVTVSLPDYFEAINRDFRYQLTVIGSFAQAIISKEVSNNQFEIATSQPNVKVSWEVKGVRNDARMKKNPFVAVKAKTAAEKGKYFDPASHNQPASRSVSYDANSQSSLNDIKPAVKKQSTGN